MENLRLIEQGGFSEVTMPCAACFNRHKTTDYVMRTDPDRRQVLEEIAGVRFDGSVAVRPLLDVVAREIGLEQVQARVRRPLDGLKAVGYYGCLLVRPAEVTQFENPEHPVLMDQLLEVLGAEARPWSYATECCGGGLSLTKSSLAAHMVSRLAERAREAGAQAIVTSCPLCQVNLEMRQSGEAPKLPVFYFTELIGLAFGLEQATGWCDRHLIDPAPVLCNIPEIRRT